MKHHFFCNILSMQVSQLANRFPSQIASPISAVSPSISSASPMLLPTHTGQQKKPTLTVNTSCNTICHTYDKDDAHSTATYSLGFFLPSHFQSSCFHHLLVLFCVYFLPLKSAPYTRSCGPCILYSYTTMNNKGFQHQSKIARLSP